MRVLITWGSKMGGTEGIARMIGDALRGAGLDVVEKAARDIRSLPALDVDAVIVGGAVYANRWHADARRFVRQNVAHLRRVPVWVFSSGPLDDSAEKKEIPPTVQVSVLMERVGALGHATFGGRLPADARGFPARAMAAKNSGDWRNRAQIRRFAEEVARELPRAKHGVAVDHPARSPLRLLAYGAFGWAICAALMYGLLQVVGTGAAIALYAVLAPLVFILVSRRYFRARGAHDPLPTAIVFTAVVVLLDAVVVAGLVQRSFAAFGSIAGTWLPLALIFLSTWATGGAVSTMPWNVPKKEPPARGIHLDASSRRAS